MLKILKGCILAILIAGSVTAEDSVYISRAEIALLPTSGAAWSSVVSDAGESVAGLDLANQDDPKFPYLFAKALVAVRTNNATMLAEVRGACMAAIGTQGDRTLALGRKLRAVVIAADLAQLSATDNTTFCNWLRGVISQNIGGRTLISTHEDRPNNWGTHAGASRIAADLYLIAHGTAAQVSEAQADLNRAALVFKGYLGDRTAYNDFSFGDLDWQSNPSQPVGINPVGALIQGHNVDGVAPDDQRRDGGFQWPPPEVNYVREAMQGVVDQAEMLHRQGFPAFTWESAAIFRAFAWFHDEAHGNFSDNGDESTVFPVNFRYSGRNFPEFSPAGPTRSLGYADWTHGPGRPQGVVADPPGDPQPTPGLVVSPTIMTVNYQTFNPAPPDQLVNVTSDGTTELVFDVTSNASWVAVAPTSGVTPLSTSVKINPAGLAVGSYQATLTYTPSSGAAKTVAVNLNVTTAPPDPDPDPDPMPGGNTIEVRVAAGSDDAEERLRFAVSLNDGDMTIVNPTENIAVATRFRNVAIPKGATIVDARIEFTAHKADSTACTLSIAAHDAGDSPTFISASKNISGRPLTANSAVWTPVAWVVGSKHLTSNFSNAVKEVVDRPDWNPGQSLTLVFKHQSGSGKRVAKNFNQPGSAALLRVTYTVP